MFTKEWLADRMGAISEAMAQSASNHNSLVGRLEECKFMLEELAKLEQAVPAVEGEVVDA